MIDGGPMDSLGAAIFVIAMSTLYLIKEAVAPLVKWSLKRNESEPEGANGRPAYTNAELIRETHKGVLKMGPQVESHDNRLKTIEREVLEIHKKQDKIWDEISHHGERLRQVERNNDTG